MILGMAKDTYRKYYGLSMEDYVGLGNMAMVRKFSRFNPKQQVPFAAYMKKVIERYILANVKKHVFWNRAEDVDIELVGTTDNLAEDRNYDFLHRAIGELSELEQNIIHYSFFDNFEPDDREIARKLRISKNYLAETRQKIFEKLRGKLQHRYLPVPDRRYIVEPRTQEELS
jgi:RNA polymerase sigma factor (sigma-70 family)